MDALDDAINHDRKKSSTTYVVLIDESGDLGKDEKSKPFFVLAASVTNKPEEFAGIVDNYALNANETIELKFNTTSYYTRAGVIEEINNVDPELYAAVIVKSNKRWGKGKEIYHLALKEFTEHIVDVSRDGNYYFLLDYHNALSTKEKPNLGCEICEKAASQKGVNITCKIVDSKSTKIMQTHDFVVGAIGSAYNKSDPRYIKKLKKAEYVYGEGYYILDEYSQNKK